MKKPLAVSALLSIVLASCSGHHTSLPSTAAAGHGGGRAKMSASGGGWGSDSQVWSIVGAINQHSSFGTGDEIAYTMATPPSGWANTATQGFAVYTGQSLSDRGVLAPSTQMNINVALQMHNAAQLKQLVAAGQQVSDAQFLSTYAPTATETQSVVSYLTRMGFRNVAADPNRLLISAQGTATQVGKAFDTTMHSFSMGSTSVYGNVGPAFVPTSLNGIVVAVLGLNNLQAQSFIKLQASTAQQGTAPPNPAPTAEPCTLTSIPYVPVLLNIPEPPNPITAPSPPPPAPQIPVVPGVPVPASSTFCERNFYANEYQNVYDTASMAPNTHIAEAVLGAGDPSLAVGDLHTNQSYIGVPLTNVVERKGTRLPDTGNQGDDEWTLDMLSSTGIGASTSTLYFYSAPDSSDNSLEATINKWASDHKAPVMNASLGLCEVQPWLDGAMHAVDQTLLYAAAAGQTLFASTGDSGSECFVEAVGENGYPGDFPDVEWPAASSYAVGVGGTSLFSQQNLSYGGEYAWDEGGGGISYFEYEPSWGASQQYVGGIFLDNPGRGLPDVAMDADLATGIFIYLSTIGGATGGPGWYVSGGTSLASPLAMGTFDRLMVALGHRMYVAPAIYQMYTTQIGAGAPPNPSALCIGPPPTACFNQGPPPTESIAGFHDVLTGENNVYEALPGYDYTTGLGSLDGGQMVTPLRATGH